jgi:hypothetical protein
MVNLDVQSELLLSFLRERREQFVHNRHTTSRQVRFPRPARRFLLITGNALIAIGTAINKRADIGIGRPNMTTEWR